MARTKRSAKLDSRNKRLLLKVGVRHLEPVQPGRYLIYQRPLDGSGGGWHARWYDSKTRGQKQRRLGSADDFNNADGIEVLNYPQALVKAEEWFRSCAREAVLIATGEVRGDGPYTVGNAIQDYLEAAQRRGMKGFSFTTQAANAHILPCLGQIEFSTLTRKQIELWLLGIAENPRRKTGKVRSEPAFLPPPKTEDEKRRRKATANRILTVLRAALNQAHEKFPFANTPWRDVKPFRGVNCTKTRFLSIEEQQALVAACGTEFRPLVQAALFTGARYGELCRLRVQDFNLKAGTLYIAPGKSGKDRQIYLAPEAITWMAEFVEGRAGNEFLLSRSNPKRTTRKDMIETGKWARYDEIYPMKLACIAAGIIPVTFHELRHAYASTLINRGVIPVYVASNLGHSDTRMVERVYGHLCANAQASAIRDLAPILGIGGKSGITPLRVKNA